MIADTSKARASFARRRAELEQRVNRALDEAQRVAMDVIKTLAPGRIPETIRVRATRGFVAGVRITSTWGKIRFVENDTAAHEIRPRNGRVVRWVDNTGSVRFAGRVHHPGTIGKHFTRAAREAGRVALRRLLEEAIRGT